MSEPARWREEALARVRPTPDEDARVRSVAEALCATVQAFVEERGWTGRARVEGSVAKGTYLHGQGDADVFVAFPPEVPKEELAARVRAMAALLDDPVVAYAEHPYAQGTFEGIEAEIVPCYDVGEPGALRSAVDRTRFHTDLVLERLDDAGRQEARLLKSFLRAAGAYGAEESVAGFSGYLSEVLVIRFGGFEGVVAWAVEGFPHPVVVEGDTSEPFEDPLVVVDPVDPTRNVAAAVRRQALVRFREAAASFRAAPDARWFVPTERSPLGRATVRALTARRGSAVLALAVPCVDEPLDDPVHAQLRRATRLAIEALEREQVPVLGARVHLEHRPEGGLTRAWGLVEFDARALAHPKRHAGPPAGATEHAERFRARWADDPAAAGEIEEVDGRLYVDVARASRTCLPLVLEQLTSANAGRVVDDAQREGTLEAFEGEAALEAVPTEALAALVDRRRPWEIEAGSNVHQNGKAQGR